MRNLNEDLKRVLYSIIYTNDIQDIIAILTKANNLDEYIDLNDPVEFNFEEFHGVSLENAIDYSELDKKIEINMPILSNKFTQAYDPSTQPLNWMNLFYELFYIIEDIKMVKYKKENAKNNVTKIIKLYEDFKNSRATVLDLNKYILEYKKNQTSKKEVIENPVERMKKAFAYFETINLFKKINLDSYYIEQFKLLHQGELLKGYRLENQNAYPLRNFFLQDSYVDGTLFMKSFSWYNNEPMVALSNATREVPSLEERIVLGYPIESIELYKTVGRTR